MTKNLSIFNTLSNKKEKFIPIDEKKVGMYVCGPTVYDLPHIGNARPLVVFDVLFRLLKNIYGNDHVSYVRNITDIDDKIILSSKEKKIKIETLTNDITRAFHNDCKYLNCLQPNVEPKATENITEMVEMISKLIENKNAYEKGSHVYFSVSSFNDYGKLSNKKAKELVAGFRVEVSKHKKNPLDFVLWKPSEENDPGWDSPWGRGRPGWHLECSVMGEKFLGKKFDIHGGGLDLIFPHHENEIAQSRCANKINSYATYWMHNGFVTFEKEKMSKSIGNIVSISDAVKNYSGQVVRLALLSAHYSQPLDWNEELMINQKNTIDKWYKLYEPPNNENILNISETLFDDLNTPGFIAKIHELYNNAKKGDKKSKNLFNSACRLLGLFNQDKNEWNNFKKINIKVSEDFILKKINERIKAKEEGNFKLADKIREELLNKGIEIHDEKNKSNWNYK
jgi:cysteinyl-tRNA synthetase